VNQQYPLDLGMFTTPLLQSFICESATSWQHLGFLPSLDHFDNLLLMTQAMHQMKAKRICNCIIIPWQYFFRKLNMLLKQPCDDD
jgi:hypothetical protein